MSNAGSLRIELNSVDHVTDSRNKLRINFSKPFSFTGGQSGYYYIAMSDLNVYYSWRNVGADYNNNTFSYIFGGVTYPVTLADGLYTLEDISSALSTKLLNNGHSQTGIKFYANSTLYKTTVVIESGFTLVIPNTSIVLLLGITAGNYTTSFNSQNSPDLTRGATSYRLRLNNGVITTAYTDRANAVGTVFSFVPDKPPGELLTYSPQNLVWLDLTQGAIQYIEAELVDDLNRPLSLRDSWSTVLLIRRFAIPK
jgi:hypothetical protein